MVSPFGRISSNPLIIINILQLGGNLISLSGLSNKFELLSILSLIHILSKLDYFLITIPSYLKILSNKMGNIKQEIIVVTIKRVYTESFTTFKE